MKTKTPTLKELFYENPNLQYLTVEDLVQYVWILSRSQAIDDCSKIIASFTGMDSGTVLQ